MITPQPDPRLPQNNQNPSTVNNRAQPRRAQPNQMMSGQGPAGMGPGNVVGPPAQARPGMLPKRRRRPGPNPMPPPGPNMRRRTY